MGNPFAQGSEVAGGLKITDYDEDVIVIRATGEEEVIKTSMGDSDAVPAEFFLVEGPHEDEFISENGPGWQQTIIFQTVLRAQLKGAARKGKPIIAKLERGVAKPGQSAPWRFGDITDSKVISKAAKMYEAAEAETFA